MNIIAFFTENGVPKTGLTPVIDVWEVGGSQIVTAQSMTEQAGGFYYYNFSTYDDTLDYVIRADGGASLPINERYAVSSNDVGNSRDNSRKSRMIEENKLIIQDDILTIYEDDGTTVHKQWDLQNESGNPDSLDVYRRLPK